MTTDNFRPMAILQMLDRLLVDTSINLRKEGVTFDAHLHLLGYQAGLSAARDEVQAMASAKTRFSEQSPEPWCIPCKQWQPCGHTRPLAERINRDRMVLEP